MKTFHIVKFVIFLIILFPLMSHGQYQFTHYTSYNTGLNHLGTNTISCIAENPTNGNVWYSGPNILGYYNNIEFFQSTANFIFPTVTNPTQFDFDSAGNLWMMIHDTIYQYDGINYISYPTGVPWWTITFDIHCATNDAIWIATDLGLFKLENSILTNYNTTNGLLDDNVNCIFEDGQGFIWVGTGQGLNQYTNGIWTSYSALDGLVWTNNHSVVTSIYEDSNGNMWAAGLQIAKWIGNSWQVLDPGTLVNSSTDIYNIESILEDENGNLWFSTSEDGLICYENGSWTQLTMTEGLPSMRLLSSYTDSLGASWFGFEHGGLGRLKNGHWQFWATHEGGLVDNVINDIFEDSDQNMWICTNNGLNLLDQGSWTSYFYGYDDDIGYKVLQDMEGNVCVSEENIYQFQNNNWDTIFSPNVSSGYFDMLAVGIDDYWKVGSNVTHVIGPDYSNPNNWHTYGTSDGLPHQISLSIEKDSTGKIWVGTLAGIAYYDGVGFTHVQIPIDDFGWQINDIRTDLEQNLWVASHNGVAKYDGTNWTGYFEAQGLANNWVTRIEIASDSTIWFATRGGVSILSDTTISSIFESDGLIYNWVHSLEQDHLGNMWIGTHQGISKLHNAVDTSSTNSICEVKPLGIELYPNPATNIVYLKIPGEGKENAIHVYNQYGSLVLQTNSTESFINIEKFNPGVYYVRVFNLNYSLSEKFIKL